MTTVDDRVVSLQFDNSKFQNNVKDTQKSLNDLNNSLNFDGITKGLNEVSAASDRFSLQGISDSVDSINNKFSAMGAVVFTVLQSLTNSAIGFGKQIFDSTFGQILSGGKTRALNLEQANFSFQGLFKGDADKIAQAMDNANTAVLGTSYSLDQAAKAASQLAASGVQLGGPMTTALRGIVGVAAQTGSSFDSVANIFETVAGNGRVMGQQITQLSYYGLNAAATLSDYMGKSQEAVRKLASEGKISADVFFDAMNKAFGDNAYKANETYTGSLDNMNAALSRLGAKFQTPWLENQRDLFNAIRPAINNVSAAIDPLINAFVALRTEGNNALVGVINKLDFSGLATAAPVFAASLTNIWNLLKQIASIAAKAFTNIFPGVTMDALLTFAYALKNFTSQLTLSDKASTGLRKTLQGLFAIFDILWQVIKPLVGFIAQLFLMFFKGSGYVLDFTGSIGDLIVSFDVFLKRSQVIQIFFDTLTASLKTAVAGIKSFISYLVDAFGGKMQKATEDMKGFGDSFKANFSVVAKIGDKIVSFFSKLKDIIHDVYEFFKPALKAISQFFTDLWNGVVTAFQGDTTKLSEGLVTGLFGTLVTVLLLKGTFFGNKLERAFSVLFGSNFLSNTKGLISGLRAPFTALSTYLNTLSVNVRVEALMKIAIAVSLLTLDMIALSAVDPVRLGVALSTLTVGLTELSVALMLMNKIGGKSLKGGLLSAAKLTIISAAFGMISVALLAVAGAFAILGTLDMGQAIIAASAMTIAMTEIVGALSILSLLNAGKVVVGALAFGVIAFSLNLVATSFLIFGTMNWDMIGRATAAMSIALGEIIITTGLLAVIGLISVPAIAGAVAMGVVAVSLGLVAGAFALFGTMNWDMIGRASAAMGIALAEVLVTLAALGVIGSLAPLVIVGAASLAVVSLALAALAGAFILFGTISWDSMGRASAAMGIALGEIAVAMLLMLPALPGAMALAIIVPSLLALAGVIAVMGALSWDTVGQGLGIMAAALGTIAGLGILLALAVPGLVGLGIAVAFLGVGVLAAGVGIAAFAAGLLALGTASSTAIPMLTTAILAIVNLFPQIGTAIAQGVISFAQSIIDGLPTIIDSIMQLIGGLLDAIPQIEPQLEEALNALVTLLVNVLTNNIPALVNAGLAMLGGILDGIGNNIGPIVTAVGKIITNFLDALSKVLPEIVEAGGNLALSFLNGVGDYVTENAQAFADAASKIFRGIIDAISAAIENGGADIRYAGQKIANALVQGAINALGIGSPSKVFRYDIMPHIFSAIGLGAKDGEAQANQAGAGIGEQVIGGFNSMLSNLNTKVVDNININPTITPVLDLSNVEQKAKQIGGLLTPESLTLDTSMSAAAATQAQVDKNEQAKASSDSDSDDEKSVTFNQYNSSPKALSQAEIYRQTNNQISQLKDKIGKK